MTRRCKKRFSGWDKAGERHAQTREIRQTLRHIANRDLIRGIAVYMCITGEKPIIVKEHDETVPKVAKLTISITLDELS